MKLRINITKKQWIRLAIFAGMIVFAAILDVYFEHNGIKVAGVENNIPDDDNSKSSVQLFSQTIDFGGKIQMQKLVQRTLQPKWHDRFLQNYHQHRNYQVLKAEIQTQTAPLILTYHYLAFRNYVYISPDDLPSIA